MDDAQTEVAVVAAIKAGYRLFDTAENYRNEQGVGAGIRASGIDRDEVFVTSKFNGAWHGYKEVQHAFDNSAKKLGLNTIDLFLIHWPLPAQGRYVDAWKGLVRLLGDGKVRAIGVSNFKPAHLEKLFDATGMAPHVNQIQINPNIGRTTEREFHAAHGIVTESWSPIARGRGVLDEAAIASIATRYSRTSAQIVLRWHVQLGLIPIPKSANPKRMSENINVFDFALTSDEMSAISALDRKGEGAVDSDRTGH